MREPSIPTAAGAAVRARALVAPLLVALALPAAGQQPAPEPPQQERAPEAAAPAAEPPPPQAEAREAAPGAGPAAEAPASPAQAATRAAAARRAARIAAEEEHPFFEEHLPAPLLRPGPRGLLWWQWLALPVLLVLALVLGSLLGWLTRRVLGHLASRTATTWDDVLIDRVARPLTLLWAIGVVTALQSWLLLDAAAEGVLERVLRAATYFVFFWGGFRAVNVAFAAMAGAPWTRTNANLAGLLPFGRRASKVALVAIGAVAVLNELGFQVASLLAGLGIGGIALALAAQKTVENLFGSLAIGVDQPFREGDFVSVDGVQGTVERIGMRSTRIRTLDRTVVTLPNGKLSDTKSETFGARDRIRLLVNLGLAYETSSAQMRQVIREVEAALRAHPRIFPDGIWVRFTDLGASSLNVEVMAWFRTTDWNEFCAIRTEVLLGFLEIVERAGTSLAFPTRTVHLVSDAGAGERTG